MSVGVRIMDYVRNAGLTQKYICSKTGIKAAKLSLMLNGKRKVSIEEYAAICNALGVSLDRFLIVHPTDQAS